MVITPQTITHLKKYNNAYFHIGNEINGVDFCEWNEELNLLVALAMKTLPLRKQKLIAMRFGLNENNPMTYKDIGRYLNVTRERARQLVQKGLSWLRNPKRLGWHSAFYFATHETTHP